MVICLTLTKVTRKSFTAEGGLWRGYFFIFIYSCNKDNIFIHIVCFDSLARDVPVLFMPGVKY